jgi:hypothetical protein
MNRIFIKYTTCFVNSVRSKLSVLLGALTTTLFVRFTWGSHPQFQSSANIMARFR